MEAGSYVSTPTSKWGRSSNSDEGRGQAGVVHAWAFNSAPESDLAGPSNPCNRIIRISNYLLLRYLISILGFVYHSITRLG
jgi:hypothetical protein